jgi:hypothetical protein
MHPYLYSPKKADRFVTGALNIKEGSSKVLQLKGWHRLYLPIILEFSKQ